MLNILIATVTLCGLSITRAQESFNYTLGGNDWDIPDCQTGFRQSPIDFPFALNKFTGYAVPRGTPIVNFSEKRFLSSQFQQLQQWSPASYPFSKLSRLNYDLDYEEFVNVTVENITNTIKCDIEHLDGFFVVYEDQRDVEVFQPLQFHFHSPSEHTFDGKHYDLELHIYHISIDKKHKSVLAVFFDTQVGGNTTSSFIDSIFTTSDNTTSEGEASWVPRLVSLQEMLDNLNNTKMLHYEGSLTTPPCTQNVEWNLIDDP